MYMYIKSSSKHKAGINCNNGLNKHFSNAPVSIEQNNCLSVLRSKYKQGLSKEFQEYYKKPCQMIIMVGLL
jgi:hypothetical protein